MEGWKSRSTKLLLAGSFSILAAVCWPRLSEGATALRWFGNDARNAGMGGTGVALGQGPGNLLMNPALMSFNPASMESTVLLPQPEWPMSATNSPLRMRRLKSLTMIAGPFGVG